MPNSGLFGQHDFSAPGWDYVLGFSPDQDWFDRASDVANGYANPWISGNIFLNQQVIKDYQQTVDARVTLEPFKDFRVEVEANRRYQENHTEFFKDTLRNAETIIEHVNERDIGSLSVSYFALNTLFGTDIDDLFRTFSENRKVISARLAGDNAAQHPDDNFGYKEGYGQFQQDVIIPAFFAAYTGQDPMETTIYQDARKFKNIMPRPNWRLTYNGLARIKGLDEIFQNVSITHGYKSNLTINSFNTNFQYDNNDPFGDNNLNPQTNNYYSRFEIPAIVIDEAFTPLLGIDMRMKNGMNMSFDYKKARRLSFSMLTNELDENNTTEFTIGFGHRMKDVNIPFLQFGVKKKKKGKKTDQQDAPGALPGGGRQGQGAAQANDLNIKFDFSFRDDVTVKHTLGQNIPGLRTRGAKTLRISPSIDYSVNSQLNLRFFVDYNSTVPYTSNGYPITNIQGGLTVRFSLN
jgi:cell surface protein SprA